MATPTTTPTPRSSPYSATRSPSTPTRACAASPRRISGRLRSSAATRGAASRPPLAFLQNFSIADVPSTQVIRQRVGDLHGHELAGAAAATAEDQSVHLGRVTVAPPGEERAATAAVRFRLAFEEDRQAPADLAPITAERNLVL